MRIADFQRFHLTSLTKFRQLRMRRLDLNHFAVLYFEKNSEIVFDNCRMTFQQQFWAVNCRVLINFGHILSLILNQE